MPDFSDKELKYGYWYFLHRGAIRRGFIVAAVLVIALIWLYASWQFVDWLSSRQAEEESMRLLVSSSVNFQEYHQRNAPLDVTVGLVTAVPAGANTYNLLAQVKNPNLKWGAKSMAFIFTAGGQEFAGTGFLLPLEDKYLVSLGAELANKPTTVSLSLGEIKWSRLRDVSRFPMPSFTVSDELVEQVPPAEASSSAGTKLRFTLTNTSPYSFWEVAVTVVLSRGSSVQAVGRQAVTNLNSAEGRPMEFYWPQGLPPADHLIVKPEVNVLEPSVFRSL
ncbi:MAG: hypothetical protein HY974_02550 [Candidatus Kerfeldbacteria bacterium]|nr:hypothetical protein [Candidatus Kerfeldbacteria bacterium]